MKSTARRFTFEINLIDGTTLHHVRVCDRKVPPTHAWVLEDQWKIMKNCPQAIFTSVEKGLICVDSKSIVSLCIIKTEEGLNVDDVKKRYGIGQE